MPQATQTVDSLREQAELLDLQLTIGQKQAALDMLGRAGGRLFESAWGDYVDPRDFYNGAGWDGYGNGGILGGRYEGPPATTDDRIEGRNRPIFETEQQLAAIRLRARWFADLDAIACGVLGKLTDYTIGSGAEYTAKPRDKNKTDNRIVDAVQEIIDETLERNSFCNDLDRELFMRAVVDGENPLAVYDVDGFAELRTIEPEQIVEPTGNKQELDEYAGYDEPSCWRFGVHTPAEDVQRTLGYHVQWSQANPADFDYLPASMVECVKLNVRRNVKRGLSDFYAVDQWFDRASKLLRNTADGGALQAAIAYIREMAPGVTQAQATSLAGGRADATFRTPTQTGTREQTVAKIAGGTIITVPSGQKYISGPMGQDKVPSFMAIVQGVLRFIGTRWSMPEFLVSGDASNANFSSTMVAESPFVVATKRRQATHLASHVRILWRAVEIGKRRYNALRNLPLSTIKRLVEIAAEPASVETRDRNKETERFQKLHDSGMMSPKTWAAKEGLDYEQEQADGAKRVETAFGPPPMQSPVRESNDPDWADRWRGYP